MLRVKHLYTSCLKIEYLNHCVITVKHLVWKIITIQRQVKYRLSKYYYYRTECFPSKQEQEFEEIYDDGQRDGGIVEKPWSFFATFYFYCFFFLAGRKALKVACHILLKFFSWFCPSWKNNIFVHDSYDVWFFLYKKLPCCCLLKWEIMTLLHFIGEKRGEECF